MVRFPTPLSPGDKIAVTAPSAGALDLDVRAVRVHDTELLGSVLARETQKRIRSPLGE